MSRLRNPVRRPEGSALCDIMARIEASKVAPEGGDKTIAERRAVIVAREVDLSSPAHRHMARIVLGPNVPFFEWVMQRAHQIKKEA